MPNDPKVAQSGPNSTQNASTNNLQGLSHARDIATGVRETSPEEKEFRKMEKWNSGRPVWQPICGTCILAVGLRKEVRGTDFRRELHLL